MGERGDSDSKTAIGLDEVGAGTRAGVPYRVGQNKVNTMIAYAWYIDKISMKRLAHAGIRWIGPSLLLLFLAYFSFLHE